MRVLIQRVSGANVKVHGTITGEIEKGLLVFIGIEDSDSEKDIIWLSNKIVSLRIFDDMEKVPNLSVKDIEGSILLISQFTLHASTKKGNRPSYIRASKGNIAEPLYQRMIRQLSVDLGKNIATGEFGADMQVELVNDGPVTIIIDSVTRE